MKGDNVKMWLLRERKVMENKIVTNVIIQSKNLINKVGILVRRPLHSTILKQMPARRDFELKTLNDKPEVAGPALYIVSHSTCHDAPIACETIQDHFYVLVGKQKLKFLDRAFFQLNGRHVVARSDSKSQQKVADNIVRTIKNGMNYIIFSEQTWCTAPSAPINSLRRGWVDIAKKAHCPVIPLALEYYEYTDNICYAKFGEPFTVEPSEDKIAVNNRLEDTLATLKFDIWNQFPVGERSKVDSSSWEQIIKRRQEEYPELDPKFESQFVIGRNDKPEVVLNSEPFLIGLQKVDEVLEQKRYVVVFEG